MRAILSYYRMIINLYKGVWPVILVLLYAGGLFYLKTFYDNFNINIIINLPLIESLYISIKFLFLIVIVIVVFEAVSYFVIQFIYLYKIKKEKFNLPKYVILSSLFELFISIIIGTVLFCSNPSSNWVSVIMFTVIILLLIKIGYTLNKIEKNKKASFLSLIIFLVTILLGFTLFSMANIDAKNIKAGESTKNIEISTEDKNYSTSKNKDLIYLSEISSTIYLYDKSKNGVIIIDKKRIKEYIIYP